MTNTSMSWFEAADLSFFPDVRFHFPVLASLWSIAVGMHWLHCWVRFFWLVIARMFLFGPFSNLLLMGYCNGSDNI